MAAHSIYPGWRVHTLHKYRQSQGQRQFWKRNFTKHGVLEAKLQTQRIGLHVNRAALKTANFIGSEAVSKTANVAGSEAVSKAANCIGSDTVSSESMATDQVAVSLETDASVRVGSTRDISKPTAATTTMTALSQGCTVLATTVLSGLFKAGTTINWWAKADTQSRCTDTKLLEQHHHHHWHHINKLVQL